VNGLADQALWTLGRGTGVVALVMLTLSVVLGILARSGRSVGGVGRFGINELHRTAALTGTGLIALHVGTLMLDPYAQLRWFDAVVPFAGQFKPLWQGLGTLAVDVLGVVTVVSLLRHRVGPRVFKIVHAGTYLLWPSALLHALGNGTDARSTWMLALAGACTAAVAMAVSWRLTDGYRERGHARTPRSRPGVPA
jgi:sulfoxide reductase heme-binding subunit YedZ